jgi:hypothetical protein
MIKKLFTGVHQSKVGVDTAAKVIGYAGSGGGAASSALGALRQFGLVDGLRGDVAVSDLALRILQPMDEEERVAAMREAAMKPEIFARIVSQFGGRLPPSDEPIRAFLIRQEGFSTAGANELIKTFRDTLAGLPEAPRNAPPTPSSDDEGTQSEPAPSELQPQTPPAASSASSPGLAPGELITLPLGHTAKAELRLFGDVSAATYSRLIRHLELLREMAAEEE